MSGGMLGSLALAAVFTLGCFGIHSARRHPDAVTIGLFLLLGLLASLYVGSTSDRTRTIPRGSTRPCIARARRRRIRRCDGCGMALSERAATSTVIDRDDCRVWPMASR